jgi:putative PEP-CTERM system TPR-repeat lipoprotein
MTIFANGGDVRRNLIRVAVLLFVSSQMLAGCDRFVSPDTRIERAQDHFAKGNYAPAITELKGALQEEPDNAVARTELARVSFWVGDLDTADKEVDRALKAGADPAQVRPLQYQILLERNDRERLQSLMATDTSLVPVRRSVLEARLAVLDKDFEAARAALNAALTAAPKDPEALVESARLAASEGKPEAALKLPDELKDSPEYYAKALYLRGAVQTGSGMYREARDTLKMAHDAAKVLRSPEQLTIAAAQTEVDIALNDAPAAQRSLAGVDALARGSPLAHFLRARIALVKGDFESVVAECQRALALAPRHVQSQLLLASALQSLGSLEQAENTLTQLLASDPDNLAARKLLAQVYLGRNEPDEARKVLGAAETADADTDWLLGAALLQSGSTESAVEHLERGVAANPRDAARRIELASIYIGARTPDKAIAMLEGVPAESPLAPRAKMLTVLATAAGKPLAQARKEVEDLAARNPNDVALLSAAGTMLAGNGDVVAGRKLLDQALTLEPKRVDTRLVLARLDAIERKSDSAQAGLLEILKIEPANQPARLALSEMAWARGDRPASRKWLEDAIKADPSAIDARLRLSQLAFVEGNGAQARGLLDQVLSVSKDRKAALTATGRVLARAGQSEEALTRFKEAVAAGDRAAHLDAARAYLDLNDTTKARQSAEAALAANAKWRDAQQLMITIDARDGKVDRAFERAKELNRNASPAALASLRGDLHAIAKQYEEAAAAYENAHRLQPTAQTAVKLFQARRAGGVRDPERSLVQWLERSPQDVTVRKALAIHYESSGQSDRALAEYERLMGTNAVDPAILNNLAWALHQKGDPRALELARRAYEGAPQYPEIADTYGWILVRMDRVPEGLTVLQSALANAPTNPDILYHAAVAYHKSGDPNRAMKLVNDALKTGREFGSKAEAQQLARELSGKKA